MANDTNEVGKEHETAKPKPPWPERFARRFSFLGTGAWWLLLAALAISLLRR